MFRRVFDPELPLVATSAFNDVAAGERFDWRARGIPEVDVVSMFASGLLAHSDALVSVRIVPGDPVQVQTPAQRDTKPPKRK